MMDQVKPFSYKAHHTFDIGLLHFVLLNMLGNHLILVWVPCLFGVWPYWVGLVVVEPPLLKNSLGFFY